MNQTPFLHYPPTKSFAQNLSPQHAQNIAVLHTQAVLCGHLARLLHHALAELDWPRLRFSDRSRLERSLTRLGGDIPLVWIIAGQPQEKDKKCVTA